MKPHYAPRPPSRLFRRRFALPLLAGCLFYAACDFGGEPQWRDPAFAVDTTGARPLAMFLTWQRDPTTTMTVDWQTESAVAEPALLYRRAGESNWRSAAAASFPFPFSPRTVHRVELSGLRPGSNYEIRFGGDSRTYSFRTMPGRTQPGRFAWRDPSRAVRFVAAGDVRHRQDWMEETGRHAASYDPDFIMFGGDLAYADGREANLERWYEWFDAYRNALVTPAGRIIPVLLAIGNHEVQGGYFYNDSTFAFDEPSRLKNSPFFFTLFATPAQPGYQAVDFGDYLSVLLLDSDHANPVDGDQARWLEEALAARTHVPHVFPLYHVPGYPSVRAFDGRVSQRVREHWMPLFERYGVRVAFENHDHAYKRTHPMRGGVRDTAGIVYIGDGAWGVGVREIGRDQEGDGPAWYLERADSIRHFILGELSGADRRFIMVSHRGEVFDEYPAGSRAHFGPPRFGVPPSLPIPEEQDENG
jgi:acid phosphatase type 7